MTGLEKALVANKAEVERELANAEAELASLRSRERTLETLIRRARVALDLEGEVGYLGSENSTSRELQVTLHDALTKILRKRGNRPMTARELATELNQGGSYRKRDGSPVEPSQIHARVHNYGRLFVREGGRIRLRNGEPHSFDPRLLTLFDRAMQEVYD